MSPALGALLAVLGLVLVAGLVNIVYKGAGESLASASEDFDPVRARRARRVAAIATPILVLAIVGGARWWGSVDQAYEATMYAPSPLRLQLEGTTLHLQASDTLWQPPGRPSALVPDHGKLMHLFLVRADDARAFAHLHPQPSDTSPIPPFRATLPPLPGGTYHVFGDVVHETGFERTLVGALELPDRVGSTMAQRSDPDDAWYAGEASSTGSMKLSDASMMQVEIIPSGAIDAGSEKTIRVSVREPGGKPAVLEAYLGMRAHAVVARVDGSVYVHLHPMGTVTVAAQEAFLARDRGDTTVSGRLQLGDGHSTHAASVARLPDSLGATVEFPYAFPKSGSYRLFVQVKRNSRVLTGAFAVTVAEPAVGTR